MTTSEKSHRILRYGPLLLILFFVLLRVLYIVNVFSSTSAMEWQAWTESPDSSGYIALSKDLEDFRLDAPSYRTPGYAIVVALLNMVKFGDLHFKVILFQQIIDGLIAYIILLILLPKGRTLALVPAILYLLHPYTLSFSSKILPATFAAFFVILASYLVMRRKNISVIQAVYIGLILSVGTMVRPMLLYSSIVLCGYLLVINRNQRKRLIFPLIILISSSYLLPLLLTHYYRTEFGMDSISSQGNFELAARMAVITGTHTQADLFCEGGFKDSIESLAISDDLIDYDLRDSIYSDIAIQLFKQNPLPVVKSHLLGWIGFFRLGNPQLRYVRLSADEIGSPFNRALQLYVLSCSVIMFPGMLLGIFQKRNIRTRNLSILALMWFTYISVIHATLCAPYYLIPILGLLLTAGYSGWIVYIKTKLQEPNSLLSRIVKLSQKHA